MLRRVQISPCFVNGGAARGRADQRTEAQVVSRRLNGRVFAASSERIGKRLMLNGYQMIRRELLDDPFAAEAADPAVLFSAKWIVGSVIDAHIVDVGHPRLQLQGKT